MTAGRAIAGIFTLGLSEAGYGIYKGATNSGDGLNHYYVKISYSCEKCSSSYSKTYEWFDNDEIIGRVGVYQHYDNDRRSMNKRLNYDTIENIFKNLKSRNYAHCQQFANTFYDKLRDY